MPLTDTHRERLVKHTPWHRELVAQGGKVTNRTGSHFVADCGKGEEAEAFAKLFAAAPGLLAALQAFMPGWEETENYIEAKDSAHTEREIATLKRIADARAALARATA